MRRDRADRRPSRYLDPEVRATIRADLEHVLAGAGGHTENHAFKRSFDTGDTGNTGSDGEVSPRAIREQEKQDSGNS